MFPWKSWLFALDVNKRFKQSKHWSSQAIEALIITKLDIVRFVSINSCIQSSWVTAMHLDWKLSKWPFWSPLSYLSITIHCDFCFYDLWISVPAVHLLPQKHKARVFHCDFRAVCTALSIYLIACRRLFKWNLNNVSMHLT